MFEWLFKSPEGEVADNIDRFGCFGSLLLLLIGCGLIVIAWMGMTESSLVWRLVIGGLGVLCVGFGVGFRWLFYLVWPR